MTDEQKAARKKKLAEVKQSGMQAAQDKLENLAGISINKDAWKTILKPMLKNLLAPTWIGSDEDLDTAIDTILTSSPGTMVQTCKAQYIQLKKAIQDFPDQIQELKDQITSIPTQISATTAAGAALVDPQTGTPLGTGLAAQNVEAIRCQAKQIKSQAKQMEKFGLGVLSQAISCGLEVPSAFTDCFKVITTIAEFPIP